MRNYRFSISAGEDFVEILSWSAVHFGEAAAKRYKRLISTAIQQICQNPERIGSIALSEFGAGIRAYHLRFSRSAAAKAAGSVNRPRHWVVYKVLSHQEIEIVRLVHDSMEFDRHLPRFRSTEES